MHINSRAPGLQGWRMAFRSPYMPLGEAENAQALADQMWGMTAQDTFNTAMATAIQQSTQAQAPASAQLIADSLAQQAAQQAAVTAAQQAAQQQAQAQVQIAVDAANAAIARANAQAAAAVTAAQKAAAYEAQKAAQTQANIVAAATGQSVESQLDLSTGGGMIADSDVIPMTGGSGIASGILSNPKTLLYGGLGLIAFLALRR